jgi:hypothetical protein
MERWGVVYVTQRRAWCKRLGEWGDPTGAITELKAGVAPLPAAYVGAEVFAMIKVEVGDL